MPSVRRPAEFRDDAVARTGLEPDRTAGSPAANLPRGWPCRGASTASSLAKPTGFVMLDRSLTRLHRQKARLLRVLERREIPLHINGSEKWHPRLRNQAQNLRRHRQPSRKNRPRHHDRPAQDMRQTSHLFLPIPWLPPCCPWRPELSMVIGPRLRSLSLNVREFPRLPYRVSTAFKDIPLKYYSIIADAFPFQRL